MEQNDKEAASRANGTAQASSLRSKKRMFYGIMIAVAVILLATFVRGLIATFNYDPAVIPPHRDEAAQKTSHCPSPQGYWVGDETVRVRYTPGCGVLRQRSDEGPDLRIWANGDRGTELRWTTTSEPNFGELVVQYVDMELWNKGDGEVYTAFTFPEK